MRSPLAAIFGVVFAMCAGGCGDADTRAEAQQRVAAFQPSRDTPTHAAQSLVELLGMQYELRSAGDKETLRAVADKLTDVVAVDEIERRLAKYVRPDRAGLTDDEYRRRVVTIATDTWPGLVAYYYDGLDWPRTTSRVSAANPSDCTVVVPARGKDGDARIDLEVRCVSPKSDGEWRVFDIRLIPALPRTDAPSSATAPASAPTDIVPR